MCPTGTCRWNEQGQPRRTRAQLNQRRMQFHAGPSILIVSVSVGSNTAVNGLERLVSMSYPIDHDRRRLLGAAALTLAGAPFGIFGGLVLPTTCESEQAQAEELKSLRSATTWLNSPPLSAAGLREKVVLIDIWTYTCINWLRTLPYVRAWDQRYRNKGLVVIGVHSPEFPFEHDIENGRRAAKE